MSKQEILQIITGFIGSIGFAVMFNVRGNKLVFASLGGLFSWTTFLLLEKLFNNQPICYFLVAVVVSAYSELMARKLKTPTTTFLMTSLIPLIPGGSLYYTMIYAFSGDYQSFITKAVYTLQLAAALALGIITVATVTRSINSLKNN